MTIDWVAKYAKFINWSTRTVSPPKNVTVAVAAIPTESGFPAGAPVPDVANDTINPVDVFVDTVDTPEYMETLKRIVPAWAQSNGRLRAFSKQATDVLPRSRPGFDHSIRLQPGYRPHAKRLRHMSPAKLDSMRAWIKEQLDKGFIKPSRSAWAANLTSAIKKDEHGVPTGELRWCVDYRGVNAATVKDRTPLPLITESLALLAKGKVFTKFDL